MPSPSAHLPPALWLTLDSPLKIPTLKPRPRMLQNSTPKKTTLNFNAHRAQGGRVHKRWLVADLREAHHSRFLLRPSALELFLQDRSTALLNFPSAKVGNGIFFVGKLDFLLELFPCFQGWGSGVGVWTLHHYNLRC